MNKKKILSSLALAGILTAGALGANVNATTVKPVGVYKRLVEGKTVVPYVLEDKNSPITVSDIAAEFSNLELVNGNAVTDSSAIVKTGDTFTANGIEYTVVVYGDVNKDGKISTKDASLVQKYVVGKEDGLDALQLEAADVNNNGKVTTKDALALQKYIVGKEENVIDELPAIEDNTAPVIAGVVDGTRLYINLNDSEFVLPQAIATDDMDGEVEVTVEGNVDVTIEGDYTVKYTATDRVGNSSIATLTVTVDGAAPIMSGVEDGENFYIMLNDAEFTLPEATATDTVDGEVEVTVEGTVNKEVEGNNTIVYSAEDTMGNVTTATITVVVDGTAPQAEVRYSTTVQTKDGVTVTIVSDEAIKAPEGWTLAEDGMSMSKLYMENVEDETLMVSDLAGNETETHINISNIDTKVVANINYDITTPTNGNVVATITSDEELQPVEGWDLAQNKMSMTKEYDKNVIADVVVKDVLENEATINVNIQNIDRVSPTAEVQFNVTTMTNGDVIVTLIANEELQSAVGANAWKINEEDARRATAVFTENGSEDVVITDLAGNASIVPVKVTNIDKTAPTLEVEYDETASTNKDIRVTITADEKVKAVEGWTLAVDGLSMTKVYSDNTTEDIKVYDLVGNESVATVTITNIDRVAPVVEGFVEGQNSYKTVTPTFVEGVATLQKDEEISQAYTSGTAIIEDGNYLLSVKDAAGNVTTINFVIDNVAPVFDTLEDVLLKNGDIFDTTIFANDEVDGSLEAELTIEFGGEVVESIDTTGAADGEYTLTYTAIDEAGNEATATRKVIVDATAAKVVSLQSSNTDAATEVTIRVEFDEKMQILEGWVAESDDQLAFTKKYTANTTESLEFKDIAGNITKVDLSINNIDSDAPSAVVSYSITEPTQGPVVATITSGEELKEVNGWTLSEDKMSMSKEFADNASEEVTISDLAGNTATVVVTVENIDKEAPVGTVSYSEIENTTEDIVVTISAEEELKEVEGWTLSEDKMSMTKTYTANTEIAEEVTISDLAGNTDTVTVEVTNIDREAPVVEGFVEGIASYKTLELTITDNTAPITVILQKDNEEATTEELESGDTLLIEEEGAYNLTVKDVLGNEIQKLFNIDKEATNISGVENGKRYTKATPVFADGVAVLNTLDTDNETVLSTVDFVSGTSITLDGNYEVVVTDAAGNSDSVKFVVDTKAPVVTNITEGETYTESLLPEVEEVGTVEEIRLVKDGVVVEDYTAIAEISEDGNYELTLTDDLGNSNAVKFVVDTTGPAVTGVEDGKSYKVAIPVFTEGTATLQKAGEEAEGFISGTEISSDGEYTLVVTDEHENATTITFTVDNVAPVVTGVEKDTTYNTSIIPETDEIEVSVVLVKDGVTVEEYTELAEIAEDGQYKLTVTDKAGNYTEVNFAIDTVVDEIEVITSNKEAATNEDVIVTITADEEMQEVEGWTLSEDKMSMTKLYNDNVDEEVTVKDLVGNEEVVNVVVSGIDKEAPTAGEATYSETDPINGNVTVTIVASEAVQKVEGWELADDQVTFTKVFEDNGTATLTLVDLAGNVIETPVEVSVENIYKTAPVISGMYESEEQTIPVGGTINLPEVTAKDAKGEDVEVTVEIEKKVGEVTITVTGTELDASVAADYTVTYTAVDAAGNETVVVRTIHIA